MSALTAPHSDLGWYIQAFFQKFPELARTGRTVMAGVYVEGGPEFTWFGVRRTPRFVLRVGNTNVEGSDLSGVSLSPDQSTAVPLWDLRRTADAVTDDETAMADVLAPYGEEGRAWARAIAGTPDRAAVYGRALREIDTVPQGAPSDQVGVLKAVLRRHFSYSDAGAYVRKWSGQGRSFPADVSPEYREAFLVEQVLERGQFYCYSVVTRDGAGGSLRATQALSWLKRIDDDTLEVQAITTAQRTETEPRREFCFFHAHDGTNVAVPASARGAFTPAFAALLADGDATAALQRARGAEDWIVDDNRLKVTLLVNPDMALDDLPQGVTLLPEDGLPTNVEGPADDADADPVADAMQDDLRVALVAADRVVELATHPAVEAVFRQTRARPYLDLALPRLNHAELLANLTATGGDGVVIGIVDSGIDGTHPAFAGRIEKVWDQTLPTSAAHQHPGGRGNDFGQVFDTEADIQAHAIDDDGHGTHVAGIAAGAANGAYTLNGAARRATILFVRTTFDQDHVRRGVEWIMREAGRRPCVVNLSLGIDWAGHDGVDDFALLIRRTFRRPRRGGGYTWLPGRTVCAAAGNARMGRYHAQLDHVGRGQVQGMDFTVAQWPDHTGTPLPVPGARFELYIRPTPRNVTGGVRVSLRVRFHGVAGAAATQWFGFDPAGQAHDDLLGLDLVRVVNGPPPSNDHRGLIFTRHQLVLIDLINPSGLTFGNYTIEVRNDGQHELEAHAYRTIGIRHVQGAHPVFFPNATERSQIGSPAVAQGIISVGATVNRLSWPTLAGGTHDNHRRVFDPATNLPSGTVPNTIDLHAQFSSTGPVRGTRRTVVIAAPGSGIFSARSLHPNAYPVDGYGPNFVAEHAQDALTIEMSGTSMACPMIAGCIANIYQRHPRLTAKDIQQALQRSPREPAGWIPEADGPGILDGNQILRGD